MKQNKLTILAASLVAAFAANAAYAGNVASSNPQVAREVITSNDQTINAPQASYHFVGDINTVSQIQTLQVQITLTSGGTWSTPAAGSIELFENDGVTAIALLGGPVTPTISADLKTLFATLTVAQDGLSHNTPVVSFNRTGVQTKIKGLASVVGTVAACDTSAQQLPFTVKHFTGVAQGSTTLAVDGIGGAVADEHVRPAASNSNVLMTFPTNLGVTVAKTVGPAKVDPAGGNLVFTTGTLPATNATLISTTLLNLGSITLKQQASGYDSALGNPYVLTGVPAASGITATATATLLDGNVEAEALNVAIASSAGFATGGVVYLSSSATCVGAINGVATTVSGLNAAVNLTGAELATAAGGAGTAPIYVCYDVAAATSAIPTSTFALTATLNKAPGDLVTYPQEQDNSCNGALFPLSGGVKIDVRNYATPSTNGNWTSVIRLINPSEVNTATVYGQLIHADGSYGNWGPIATLAPRASTNMTADAINVKLVNVPATVTPGAAGPVANASGADRLRVTADGVSSLRVQNYLYNPDSKNFIEASSTQAVDFEGSIDRAPATEGQYQYQDAQTGLVK